MSYSISSLRLCFDTHHSETSPCNQDEAIVIKEDASSKDDAGNGGSKGEGRECKVVLRVHGGTSGKIACM